MKIGIFTLTTFTVIMFFGVVGMFICTMLRRKKYGINTVHAILFTLALTLTGVLGAKLMFAVENGFRSWGGISFFGSVFLIPALIPLFGLLFRLKFSQSMDLCAPCVAIMIACLRINCLLSGCCGGWQVCWGNVCFYWPTQAIESVVDFAIFIWLLRLDTKNDKMGTLYPTFMLSYSSVRFIIEFFRDTSKDWLMLSHGQWFSIAAIAISVIWLLLMRRKKTVYKQAR